MIPSISLAFGVTHLQGQKTCHQVLHRATKPKKGAFKAKQTALAISEKKKLFPSPFATSFPVCGLAKTNDEY